MIRILAVLVLLAASLGAAAQEIVVYHFDSGLSQAVKGLRNMRNHLDTDPKAQLVGVAHAQGVDFLMEGAKTPDGQEFASLVQALENRGVKFQICEITLRNRNISKDKFIMGPTFVPSGVVQIAHLQAQEHYAYIKP
jgi:intracellular sulfur oxidation DsrE/DsrF family protein